MVRVYLTDFHRDYLAMNAIYAGYFKGGRLPARTCVGVSGLAVHALVEIDQVFTAFRSRFIGKVSPVHFFWGSFDHAVTRFSGRRAPPPPSNPMVPDRVNHEAYSHEVSSCGFWPGNGGFGEAAFYCYAYPQPDGFAEVPVQPSAAYYSQNLGEFVLPYEAVRQSADPSATLLEFLQSTYAAAANLARWDRTALEH